MTLKGFAVVSCIPRDFSKSLGRINNGDDDASRFARHLPTGAEIRKIDATEDVLPRPDELFGYGVIIGGSPCSVNDRFLPWLPDLRRLVLELYHRGTPMLGVCFGHQLIATILGGTVELNTFGREFGYLPIFPTQFGLGSPLTHSMWERRFSGEAGMATVAESHREIVTKLPAGALRLAWNATTWTQAAFYGLHTYGVQFHPEARRELMKSLAIIRYEELIRGGFIAGRKNQLWPIRGIKQYTKFVHHGLSGNEPGSGAHILKAFAAIATSAYRDFRG